MEGKILFNDYDLTAILDNQRHEVSKKISEVPSQKLVEIHFEELVSTLERELQVQPIIFLKGEIYVDQTEAKVDVSQDPMRGIDDRSRPFYIDGIRISFHVPYSGDRELFKCRPSRFNLNPPYAIIDDQELILAYEITDKNLSKTRQWFDNDFRSITEWVSWINQQVEGYNHNLTGVISTKLNDRKQMIQSSQQQLDELGFKVKQKDQNSHQDTEPNSEDKDRAKPKTNKSVKKISQEPILEYDVALSFAGEDRDYVAKVATFLKEEGIKVFYDRFEEAELWGKNLIDHFGEIYSKKSRYIVMFISKHYVRKDWTNHERKFAQERALSSMKDYLLPVRFDDTNVPGLPSTVGYIDLRHTTPEKLTELIKKRINS